MRLCEKIRIIRRINNMTQKAFSESLGISRSHLACIEADKANPSTSLLVAISAIYGVPRSFFEQNDFRLPPFEFSISKLLFVYAKLNAAGQEYAYMKAESLLAAQ